jgi:hypothetical protein
MYKILLIFLIPVVSFAESVTTDNLLLNNNFETGNSSSWQTQGDVTVLNDCCPGGFDLEFGPNGQISQQVQLVSEDITEAMLNSGIQLDSSVEVQNGECSTHSDCWGGQGDVDTFSIILKAIDKDGNILATHTQQRQTATGINGVAFTDQLIYGGTGSYYGDITITGQDSNNSYLGGPNIDNVSLTLTYDDTVLSATATEEINTTFELIEEILEITEVVSAPPVIEELLIEEITFEEVVLEPEIIEIETIEEQEFIEENIVSSLTTQNYEEEITENIVETNEAEILEEQSGEEYEQNEGGNVEESIEEVSSQEASETEIAESEPVETREEFGSEGAGVGSTGTDEGGLENNSDEVVLSDTGIETKIDKIKNKIDNLTLSTEKKLALTSVMIAKALSDGRSIDSYSSVNDNLFKDLRVLDGGVYKETRTYFDSRDFYSANQDVSLLLRSKVSQHLHSIDKARDNVIEAEENLRRVINGF